MMNATDCPGRSLVGRRVEASQTVSVVAGESDIPGGVAKQGRARTLEASRPLGWAGRAAAGTFALHALLLFFPPIPPYVKGSLLSYTLGHLAVLLALVELRAHGPTWNRYWGDLPASRRVLLSVAAALATLILGLSLRWAEPELFVRWSREEGIWEPLTLAVYLWSAVILLAAARVRAGCGRRHLQLFAGGYVLLSLEEVDYLGIFGGLIGRVEGVYVGSPHDVIALAANGILTPWMVSIAVALLAVAAVLLVRSGYLQPTRFVRTVFARRGLWLLAYLLFVSLAQVEDTGVFYVLGQPRMEELLELVGSLFLFGFAADLARPFGPSPTSPVAEPPAHVDLYDRRRGEVGVRVRL